MHTFTEAKLMAKLLRQALSERGFDITHGDSLELVARLFGLADWNILSAKIDDAKANDPGELPPGWTRAGKPARRYRTGVDRLQGAAWIENAPAFASNLGDDDYCTLMQSVDATPFRGQRLQLRTSLRADAVDGGVTVWFRIDGPLGSLRFENLERYERGGPISGTTKWTDRTIVLDVPEEATTLNYGFYLKGTGKGWARGFSLEVVDASVPLNTPDTNALQAPTNLDFRQIGPN
jgi:hypothetical protein